MSSQKLTKEELRRDQKRFRLLADINDAVSNEELAEDVRELFHAVNCLLIENSERVHKLANERTSYAQQIRQTEDRLNKCVKALQHYANPAMYEHFDDIEDIETDAIHAIDLDQGAYAQETLKKVGKFNEKI